MLFELGVLLFVLVVSLLGYARLKRGQAPTESG